MAQQQYPREVENLREGPEHGETGRPFVPARKLNTDYPLIDSDPHFRRVISYARGSDYLAGSLLAASGPALMLWWERISPSEVGKGGFASVMRLSGFISLTAGFLYTYQRSIHRFYGFTENRREIERDMREMTDCVKRGEPLYGKSSMAEYMQGVASRQSRYSGVFLHVMPWFNFVNHAQHGVDTAKYYRNAERELEAERQGS
ncbi:NADH-ubiquinone oxidoreductase 20.9 kDa subunit [Cryoendolithus antarcticus]|uniref:NADH-ubiquinone oxidoreductase 20.9 kDa subunit n=1 Tax=Cryoendolithus antarcticus TaxID=1507870 RepID=A0A1V8T8R5_9PEZI|nr:NADH-ubiquinone oxidoreductase 20.9 kDa subunit [Cryoendolithus antarcticus]